jgi:hypothetical protein
MMPVSRYIRNVARVAASLGPTEERGLKVWVGYDVAGIDGDYSSEGLINVDGWSDEQLAEYGVTSFIDIEPEKLGIRRNG